MVKWFFIIISLCVSISALILSVSENDLYSSPSELYVSILGILVTVLIGWQVINAITIKKDIDEIRNRFDTLQKTCQKAVNSVHKDATARN